MVTMILSFPGILYCKWGSQACQITNMSDNKQLSCAGLHLCFWLAEYADGEDGEDWWDNLHDSNLKQDFSNSFGNTCTGAGPVYGGKSAQCCTPIHFCCSSCWKRSPCWHCSQLGTRYTCTSWSVHHATTFPVLHLPLECLKQFFPVSNCDC